ncbi:hypothetical protein BX666DRAFT_2114239 [Dichotomocladium elegans]|nr:hypothetical protein BX666DRAFT_2114239 [Dichotomocladium elegans]
MELFTGVRRAVLDPKEKHPLPKKQATIPPHRVIIPSSSSHYHHHDFKHYPIPDQSSRYGCPAFPFRIPDDERPPSSTGGSSESVFLPSLASLTVMSPTQPHSLRPDLDYLLNEYSHHLDAPTTSRNSTTTVSRYEPYLPIRPLRRRHMMTIIDTSPDRPRQRNCNAIRITKDPDDPIIIGSDETQNLDLFPSIPEQPVLFSNLNTEEPVFSTDVSSDDTVFSDFALFADSSWDSSDFEPNTVDDDFVLIP